jgi:hypothetical protein
VVARIVPRGQNGTSSSTYARIVSQEKTRKSPDLGRATSVQYDIKYVVALVEHVVSGTAWCGTWGVH